MTNVDVKKRGLKPTLKDGEPWTEEELAELRRLRSSGATFKQIGMRLGRTRAAISRKVDVSSGRAAVRQNVQAMGGADVEEGRVYRTDGGRVPVRISLGGPEWSRPRRFQA